MVDAQLCTCQKSIEVNTANSEFYCKLRNKGPSKIVLGTFKSAHNELKSIKTMLIKIIILMKLWVVELWYKVFLLSTNKSKGILQYVFFINQGDRILFLKDS